MYKDQLFFKNTMTFKMV